MEVDLEEFLRAAQTFSDMGASYGSAIETISGAADIESHFETGEVSGAWSSMVNSLWGYLADSHDNLYDSNAVMINYINAICAKDGSLSEELLEQVRDYNDALSNSGGPNDDIPDPLPEPDPDNPDGPLPKPDYDPADRPGD